MVVKVRSKVDDLYRGSLQFDRIASEPLYNTLLVHWTRCRCHFSMKALARYQIILLGEQNHIRCEQLARGCCPIMLRQELNSQPLDRESNALPLHYRAVYINMTLVSE